MFVRFHTILPFCSVKQDLPLKVWFSRQVFSHSEGSDLLLLVPSALKTMAAVMLSPCPAGEEGLAPDDLPGIQGVTKDFIYERKYVDSLVVAPQVLAIDKLVTNTNTL